MTVIEKLENNVAEVNSAFQNIKSKIASHGVEVDDELRPSEYASKVDAVYEAGKKAEYDEFWDTLQKNGNLTDYNYAFAGKGWNDTTFKPKYDIKPRLAIVGMFRYCAITDLEARLKECGVVLDTSDNVNYTAMFYQTAIVSIPEITISGSATNVSIMFSLSNSLRTIRKIILKDGFNATMIDSFSNCPALENVVFEGVIPQSISFAQSVKLSKASITNIVEHLSTTASGQTATFSKTAVETAFGSVESAEWQSLIATKSNWTISLV